MELSERRPWWSARVSGVLWLLVIVFGCLGLIITVGGGTWMISARWITPREKRAAIAALNRIDDVRKSEGPKDEVYKEEKIKAENAVEKANSLAITSRDKAVASWLDADLTLTTIHKEHLQPSPLSQDQQAQYQQLVDRIEKSIREN